MSQNPAYGSQACREHAERAALLLFLLLIMVAIGFELWSVADGISCSLAPLTRLPGDA